MTPVRTGPVADLERTLAAHDRGMADAHAWVMSAIAFQRPRRAAADRQAELAQPRHRTRSTS